MHETAVAQSVLETILEQAVKFNARPVRAVISCGQFNALNDEAMRFAFGAAAEGTVCDTMELVIKHIPLRARCDNCGRLFDFDIYAPACPECQSEHFDFQADAPLLLEEIEFENPNDKGGL